MSSVKIAQRMATFTALVKIISTNFVCITKLARVGEIFIRQKFSCIHFMYNMNIIGAKPSVIVL